MRGSPRRAWVSQGACLEKVPIDHQLIEMAGHVSMAIWGSVSSLPVIGPMSSDTIQDAIPKN